MIHRTSIVTALTSTWLLSLCCPSALPAQQMPAPSDSHRVVQMHDAKQLVTEIIRGQTPAQERKARDARLESLVSFARTFVTPPLAAEEDIAALSGRYLVALGRPAQQEWLDQLLKRNIAKGTHQIDLEIRQLRIPDPEFTELMPPFGIDPEPKHPNKPLETSPGRYQALLDDTELNLILRAVEKAKNAEILQAPRLLLHPMTPATVETGTNIEYIKDYVVETKDGKQVSRPIRETLFDGLRIDASCGVVSGEMLGISFHYKEREVVKPIPDFKTKIGLDKEVTVQLPASTVLELEQRIELQDGQTALLAIKNGKGPHIMFLVRASLVVAKPMNGGR